MTDAEEMLVKVSEELKNIKERYGYSNSEVTAYLQGQRDMTVDLINMCKE